VIESENATVMRVGIEVGDWVGESPTDLGPGSTGY